MKKFVDQNLNEFARRGRPKKVEETEMKDDWYDADDEFDAPESGPEEIEDVEIEDEVSDAATVRRITRTLNNELDIPEFSREELKLKKRSTRENIRRIPLAKLAKGESYLFKTPK